MALVKSWVEISGARLGENLRAVQAVASAAAGTDVETLAVVKANGYGHDAALVAPVLVAAGARWLGVSDVEEGMRVRAALGGGTARILVMCGMELRDAPAMVAYGLTPVVWTVEHVEAMELAAAAAGQQSGQRVRVHVEVDTGMSRQGAMPGGELQQVLARLAASRWVTCEGVMSHLAAAEVSEGAETRAQTARFEAALEQVAGAGVRPELVHLGNTSAVDEGSTMRWVAEAARRLGARPMVRTGLAVYGHCLPVEAAGETLAGGTLAAGRLAPLLKPVLTWKTRVIGLREIAVGTTVGYGATFVAKQPMRLALLPVGYADGFRRASSSSPRPGTVSSGDPGSGVGDGWVMVGGERAKVVGRVSMNLMSVDVTGIPVEVGDEVVLLGEGVSAEEHACWSGTIAYDILCGIRAGFVLV